MRRYLISGAGSGIGQAMAEKLAKNEANQVILLGRQRDKLENTKESLPFAKNHLVLAVDVTDPHALHQGLGNLKIDDLYAVIANAGVSEENHYGPDDLWKTIIEINLFGSYALVNEALPYLRKSSASYRHVLLVSSVLAHMGVPSHSAYCASKAGQLGMMRSWASEWASEKILVNAICPGWVETDMAAKSIQRLADTSERPYDKEYRRQMNLVPLKKSATPSEIAGLANYLISPEQTSITGEEVQINNGAYMI